MAGPWSTAAGPLQRFPEAQKIRIAATSYEIPTSALGQSSAMAALPGVSRSDAAPVAFASLAIGRSEPNAQPARRNAAPLDKRLCFSELCYTIFACQELSRAFRPHQDADAAAPKKARLRRLAAPPTGEADRGAPTPPLMQVLEKT